MQNRVGPILKAVKFLAEPSAKDLHRAMEHFRLKDGAIDKTAPVDFLTSDDRTAVSRDGRFSVSLYKALLFLQVQNAIKSGTLNLEHSYKYRPLDAYLIDRERWQRDKPLLIERADLQAFLDPHQVLADLDAALYRQYLTTNAHKKRHSFHRCVWLQRSHLWHQPFGGRLLRAPFQEPQTSTTLYLQEPPTPGSFRVEN
jgi:hypothetical protein